jgi:hypothetical protein
MILLLFNSISVTIRKEHGASRKALKLKIYFGLDDLRLCSICHAPACKPLVLRASGCWFLAPAEGVLLSGFYLSSVL